jgi:hypothetical protein
MSADEQIDTMVRAGVMTKEAAVVAKKHFAELEIAKKKQAEAETPALDTGPSSVEEGA